MHWVVLILTITVSFTIIGSITKSFFIPLSENRVKLITTLVTSVIAILSVYVGHSLKRDE